MIYIFYSVIYKNPNGFGYSSFGVECKTYPTSKELIDHALEELHKLPESKFADGVCVMSISQQTEEQYKTFWSK